MSTVFLKFTEGCCWRRVIDVKIIERYFLRNNWKVSINPENADVIIIETCAFVKRTEDIAIEEIRAVVGRNYHGRLIITGCLPGINLERLRKYFSGAAVNTAQLEKLNELFPEFDHKLSLFDDTTELFTQKDLQSTGMTLKSILHYLADNFTLNPGYWMRLAGNIRRVLWSGMGLKRNTLRFLRIAWGCPEPHCTFCVEWKAVGSTVISKPADIVLREVKDNLAEGVTRFAVIADSPATWGSDIGSDFTALLSSVLEVDRRIVLANLDGFHPRWLIRHQEKFLQLLRSGRIRSLMSALQSGNNRILKLMNRQYTREEYLSLMKSIRRVCPEIVLITQIIVGFPSETFEEFRESVDLVIACRCTNVTLFPFYSNPLTPAAGMEGMINDAEKFRRIDYALKRLGSKGILSFNMGVEINPKYQETKALYDNQQF
ncbi:MAG: radical SAM protein [Chitinispirillaceae bacterium]|nr:radical SAM protein [Chitinispirillaceae bacterium]